jgi:N-acetylneuraminic acid mutarotase
MTTNLGDTTDASVVSTFPPSSAKDVPVGASFTGDDLFERGCDSQIHATDNAAEVALDRLGPLVLYGLSEAQTIDRDWLAADVDDGVGIQKYVTQVDGDEPVWLAVARTSRSTASLIYDPLRWDGDSENRLPLDAGDSVVRFDACGNPSGSTQYNGGLLVDGPACVTFEVYVGESIEPPLTLVVPFGVPACWTPLVESPLSPRNGHTAIWTGEEVLFWGGSTGPGAFAKDGAAYDADTETWRTFAQIPSGGRMWHSAVWTGTEMIIWGGFGDSTITQGWAYDPTSDKWRPIADAPIESRWLGHSTSWTGTEMIVWGNKRIDSEEPVGAAYNPATDSWRALPEPPISGRVSHSAAWTGEELIVWGGAVFVGGSEDFDYVNDGAAYNPTSDTWRSIATPPIEGRWRHTAVWTGDTMIIWGGAASDQDRDALADGAAYNPTSDTWTTIPPSPLDPRNEHAGFWTDQGMIIWGGHVRTSGSSWRQYADGATYNPATETWTLIDPAPATGTITTTPSVWAGNQLLYWGQGNDFRTPAGATIPLPIP